MENKNNKSKEQLLEDIDHLKSKLSELEESQKKINKSEDDELRKTRERLELALDASEHGFWDWNLDTDDIYFSPNYFSMLGYKPNDLQMRKETWVDLMHPDDKKKIIPEVEKYVKNGRPYEVEFRLKTKDGKWKWISGKGKFFEKDKNGVSHRAVGVHIDITERKKVEEIIKESEERFKILSSLSFEGILINHKGIVIDLNDSLSRMFGYTKEEMIGKNIINLCIPKEYHQQINKNLLKEIVPAYDVIGRKKDGSLFPIEIEVKVANFNNKKYRVTAIRDITERKKSEEVLNKTLERYHLFVKASKQLLWTTNAVGEVEEKLSSWTEFTGRTYDEIKGLGWIKDIHPDDRERIDNEWNKAVNNEILYESEYRLKRYDGVYRNFLVRGYPIFDNKNNIIEWFGACIDITELKEAEEEIIVSEKRFQTYFKQSMLGMAITSLDKRWIEVNDTLCEMLGYSFDELSKIPWKDLTHPDDLKSDLDLFNSMLALEIDNYSIRKRFIRKDGSIFFTKMSVSAFLKPDGKSVDYILAILDDISVNIKAEEELRRSEAKFHSLFSEMGEGVYLHEIVYDDKGTAIDYRVLEANISSEKHLNIKVEDALGKLATELYETKDPPFFKKYLNVAETGKPISFEQYFPPMNKYFHVSVYSPGKGMFATVFLDISERKKAEKALLINESRLEALVAMGQMTFDSLKEITDFTLEEAIKLCDSEIGYLAFVNKDENALTMHSWSKIAMEECRLSEKPIVYPLEKTGLWGEAIRQRKTVITNDFSAPNPHRKGYPKGHIKLIRHMNIPLFDGGKIVAVVGVGNKNIDYDSSDVRQLTLLIQGMWKIYKRKQAEDELEKYRENLENLIEKRTAEIEEKNKKLFHQMKIFVGREMKIKSLEKENKALRGK